MHIFVTKCKAVLFKLARHLLKLVQVLFVLLALNSFALYTNINCQKGTNNCLLSRVPSIPTSVATYIDFRVISLLCAFYTIQALVSVLPLGKLAMAGNYLEYRINGLYFFLITAASAPLSFYFGKSFIFQQLYLEQLKCITGAAILALTVSVLLYLKFLFSKKRRGHVLDDLFIGAQANPRVCKIDIKSLVSFRFGHYLAVLVYFSYLEASYRESKVLNQPLAIAAIMQFVYSLLVQILQEDFLDSYLIKENGLSYARIFHHIVITPFVMTLPGRFLLEHPSEIKMPQLCMLGCLIPFVCGAVLFYQSNALKGKFKRDPDHPDFSHQHSISDGRTAKVRFISSGLFRYVRHPNYTGDLLMHLAMALLVGCVSFVPYLPFVYLLLLSFCRIWRMERDISSRSRAGASVLEQYTTLVPHRLIPKIF
jgi:protein-S-isoprenylcysteine O-methyltransferase Ste14